MKKYLIFTSLFALAACGGGSGSHSGGSVTPVGPTFRSADLFSNTANNGNVTQMQTQVIVDSSGRVITPNVARRGSVRSSSVQDTSGNTYNVYDLSDVKLKVADQVPAWLKIGLAEDGAIKDITLSTDGVESKLSREGTTNTFRGPIFEYADSSDHAMFRMVDGTDFGELAEIEGFDETLDENGHVTMDTLTLIETNKGLTGGQWNYIDERMDVKAIKHIAEEKGIENAVGLQYSDFGHFNPVYRQKHKDLNASVLSAIRTYGADIEAALIAGNETDFDDLMTASGLNRASKDKYRTNEEMAAELNKEDYQLFAGGYAIDSNGNLIESGTFEAPRNTTFSGTGIGRVYTSIEANANGTEKEYRAAVLDQFGIAHDATEASIRDAGHDVSKTFVTSSASLSVDASGNQELVMNFPDFYKVTATQNAAGGDPVITMVKPDGVTIEKQYMKTGDVAIPTYTDETHQVISVGTATPETPAFQPGYYGVGSASEAAGFLRYAEGSNNIQVQQQSDDTIKSFTREFEFQGAYGMKKD